MKTFKETIKIEVPVSAIAQKLLGMFKEDEKHAELVVGKVITDMIESGSSTTQLSGLYNSMNGFTDEVDFEVGDKIVCTEKISQFTRGEDGEVSNSTKYLPIGNAIVTAIDTFSNNKLTIEYEALNRDGELITSTKNVNHKTCNKLQDVVNPKTVDKIEMEV